MAGGWSKDGDVQKQIDDSVTDAVRKARARLRTGPSATHCDECGDPIPQARRERVAGVRTCVPCQEALDAEEKALAGFNRRGSKDSQLR